MHIWPLSGGELGVFIRHIENSPQGPNRKPPDSDTKTKNRVRRPLESFLFFLRREGVSIEWKFYFFLRVSHRAESFLFFDVGRGPHLAWSFSFLWIGFAWSEKERVRKPPEKAFFSFDMGMGLHLAWNFSFLWICLGMERKVFCLTIVFVWKGKYFVLPSSLHGKFWACMVRV